MRAVRLTLILLLSGLLAGCGFKLRGSAELPGYTLPFASIALSLAPTSEFHAELKRTIEASSPGTRVVTQVREAEALLSVIGDRSDKLIISLTAAGRAREYQLVRTFTFRVAGTGANAQTEFIPQSTIVLRREITFSDDLVLSKESEETLIWRDIQRDLVQQLMRRLAAAKVQPAKPAG